MQNRLNRISCDAIIKIKTGIISKNIIFLSFFGTSNSLSCKRLEQGENQIIFVSINIAEQFKNRELEAILFV